MKNYIAIITLALLLVPRFATAQGNLVVNGGFDTTSGSSTDGWTLTGAAYANVKNGNPLPDVVLGSGQSASQTISSLSPGMVYIVSGDFECSGTDTTNISFQVTLDSVPFFQTAVPTDPNWNEFNFEYTATSSSAVLSLSQTYWAYLSVDNYSIDNVAMYAVPEPTSVSLFIICLLLLCWAMKRPNISRACVKTSALGQ